MNGINSAKAIKVLRGILAYFLFDDNTYGQIALSSWLSAGVIRLQIKKFHLPHLKWSRLAILYQF
jgi:hypothetical protein